MSRWYPDLEITFKWVILSGWKNTLGTHRMHAGKKMQFLKCHVRVFSVTPETGLMVLAPTHWNSCFTQVGIINWRILLSSSTCHLLFFTPKNRSPSSSSPSIFKPHCSPFSTLENIVWAVSSNRFISLLWSRTCITILQHSLFPCPLHTIFCSYLGRQQGSTLAALFASCPFKSCFYMDRQDDRKWNKLERILD